MMISMLYGEFLLCRSCDTMDFRRHLKCTCVF